jgi:excisionase family DNA binding protein
MDPSNFITVVAHPGSTDGLVTHSDEALTVWTPVLGPTAMLLAYRLAGDVERDGSATHRIESLADDLRVNPSKIKSAIARLHRNHVAVVDGDQVAIRLALPEPTRPKPSTEALTLTVPEAAELLGLSRAAAYQAVRSGEIPSVQIGRRWLIPRARLMELLAGPTEDDA